VKNLLKVTSSWLLITGYSQNNVAVSKVNKKSISNLTRAQPTPSAAATVQVSHALPAVRFLALPASISIARNSRCTVITDLDTSKRSTQKAFSAATPSWKLTPRPRSPAVSMRSELLVADKKLGQLPLLTVYVLPV
jgi:hypothetical protein